MLLRVQIMMWDVRNQRNSVVYPFHTQLLSTSLPSSTKKPLRILSIVLHPENSAKLAFLGQMQEGMVVGLLEMRSLAISHLKCISPCDVEESDHTHLMHRIAWQPQSDTVLSGTIHFCGSVYRSCVPYREQQQPALLCAF